MDTGNNSPAAADADAVVVVRRATKMHGSRPAPDPEGVVCIHPVARSKGGGVGGVRARAAEQAGEHASSSCMPNCQ